MKEIQYSEAAIEVLDILNHTEKEDVDAIPQSFIKFLIDISKKSYKSNLNHEQPISELNLKEQTREILGFIYITWWSSKEEREKYKSIIRNEKIKKEEVFEQYDVNDIFKNRTNKEYYSIKNEDIEQTNTITYKKESIIKKFLLGKY